MTSKNDFAVHPASAGRPIGASTQTINSLSAAMWMVNVVI